ncbi:MAG TPA: DNA polymerase III subunit gamma/tau [Solirubrobacteraceae bacterium]|jgi:DNA polymerase-3 subunit gamma/tau
MSSVSSLYRRHRPRTFADVVGQDPVVRTLRNAVELEKVHHAYLFVGARGTGKTSTAKILAACLNCEQGPTTEPCGQCESCNSIAQATSLDVIEMDAASNNSVDDIRELRESVVFAPISGRHKVYILDEAHMLSTAAWNAFLKTLEEPPPGTVFVLATTEAQKVPATVVDRCHRFDFHRPTVEQIISVLARTAEAEQIEIPPAALSAIARSATGSFRDALGTLEQLVTYSGQQIELADVLEVLGVVDSQLLAEVFDAVAAGDERKVLLTVAACVGGGRDASAFAADLEVRARELLVVRTLGEVPAELRLTEESDALLERQAEALASAVLVRIIELLAGAMEALRAGADSRTQLELALVKAASPAVDASTRALLARIERLEETLGSSSIQAQPNLAPVAVSRQETDVKPPVSSEDQEQTPEPEPEPEPVLADAPESPAIVESPTEDPLLGPTPEQVQESEDEQDSEPAHSQPAPEGDRLATLPPAAEDIDSVRTLWPAVVDLIRTENALLGALIAESKPASLSGEELVLAFAPSAAFLKKKAEDPANRALVMGALQQLTGVRLRPSYELRGDVAVALVDQQDAPSEQDLVERLMAEFDAEEIPREDPEA